MINPNTIYRKTEAGVAEVQSRALGLRAELRRLLILMDGTASVAKLATFVRGAEIEILIAELERHGLVVTGMSTGISGFGPLAATTSTPAAPMIDITSAPAANVAASADSLLEPTAAQVQAVRRTAVRTLHDLLGPDADNLAIKIERCTNANEMRAAVTEVRQVLDRQMGVAAGQRFLDAVRGAAEGTR